MRISVLLSLTAAGLVSATGTNEYGCGENGNNCRRAVFGAKETVTVEGVPTVTSVGARDCSSFLLGTVTTTPTTTVTNTWYTAKCGQHGSGGCPNDHPWKRDAPVTTWPSIVPTYASACTTVQTTNEAGKTTITNSASAYASACSCTFGLTSTVTTLSAPEVTEYACVNKEAPGFKLKKEERNRFGSTWKWVESGVTFTLDDDFHDASTFFLVGENITPTSWADLWTCRGNDEKEVHAPWGKLTTNSGSPNVPCKKVGQKLQCSIGSGPGALDEWSYSGSQLKLEAGNSGFDLYTFP